MSTTQITDGTNTAVVNTALPASSAAGLVVRDAAQGQQTSANSRPVVLASDQSAIPVTVSTMTPSTPHGAAPFTNNFKLFDSKFLGQDNLLLWYQSLTGGGTGTFSAPDEIDMTLTTASGDRVIRQTQRVQGQGGVTMIWEIEGVMGVIKANVRQRMGAFDANDGLFFEQDGTNLKVVVRTSVSGSPVDTAILQSAWNIDKLDGTGASGITLNNANHNLFFATYNTGFIEFGIVVNGNAYFCHKINGPNTIPDTTLATRNSPLRAEITNTGTAASGTTLTITGAAAFASGGTTPLGIIRSVNNGIAGSTIGLVALVPLISIRLNSNSVRNTLIVQSVNLLLSASEATLYEVIFNGTLTGASFVAVPGTNSISEYDITATAITGGDVFYSNYASGQGAGNAGTTSQGPVDVTNLLKVSSNIAGVSDIITFAAQATAAPSPSVFASLIFKELV